MEDMDTVNKEPVQNEVMDTVYDLAKKSGAIIAFAESEDPKIGKAVERIKTLGLPEPVLLTPDSFSKLPPDEQRNLVEVSVQARAEKGKPITADYAKQVLTADPKYVAAAMVRAGLIDAYIAGNRSTSKDAITPALQIIGSREGYASSFFIMCWPDGSTLFFADCGFNPNPNAEELGKIGVTTARNVQRLGLEPRVAFLSFSTAGSAEHPDVEKVRQAIAYAKAAAPELKIADHELQFDAALNEEIAAHKVGASDVAGKANVLVFPDLDAGNIAYKVAKQLGVREVGPIMQGLNQPANDLSRGVSVQGIVDVFAVTAMQAGALKKSKEN
jgi:phosphate acetyltransferase